MGASEWTFECPSNAQLSFGVATTGQNSGTNYVTGNYQPAINSAYSICGTYSTIDNVVRLYTQGVQRGTATKTGDGNIDYKSNVITISGYSTASGGNIPNYHIDVFYIFNRQLTPAEIVELHHDPYHFLIPA